jgi:hypothetical protein
MYVHSSREYEKEYAEGWPVAAVPAADESYSGLVFCADVRLFHFG